MERPPYRRGLGICTGDIVRTSYGTGPYEVWDVHGPHQFVHGPSEICIWPYPVVSLSLLPVQRYPNERITVANMAGINEIRREGDRWFTRNSEVLVTPGTGLFQPSLFGTGDEAEAEPYRFQEGVNYREGRVWHCERCGRDFDDTQLPEPPRTVTTYSRFVYGPGQRVRPDCPDCGAWPIPIYWVGPTTNALLARTNNGR
jgi:hypothetical protein